MLILLIVAENNQRQAENKTLSLDRLMTSETGKQPTYEKVHRARAEQQPKRGSNPTLTDEMRNLS